MAWFFVDLLERVVDIVQAMLSQLPTVVGRTYFRMFAKVGCSQFNRQRVAVEHFTQLAGGTFISVACKALLRLEIAQ